MDHPLKIYFEEDSGVSSIKNEKQRQKSKVPLLKQRRHLNKLKTITQDQLIDTQLRSDSWSIGTEANLRQQPRLISLRSQAPFIFCITETEVRRAWSMSRDLRCCISWYKGNRNIIMRKHDNFSRINISNGHRKGLSIMYSWVYYRNMRACTSASFVVLRVTWGEI